ncbi:ADP-ribosylation factor-like protein 9 isoform X1 [Nothobranchius furzeri]
MFGLREAGVIGASVALAGGIAYVIWNRVSSPQQKKLDSRPEKGGKNSDKEEEEEETEAVVSAKVQKTYTIDIRRFFKRVSEEQERDQVVDAEEICMVKSHPVKSEGTQILVLGLDGAGKTSLLHCFSSGVLEQDVEPTHGSNAVSVSRDDLHIEFLEIGGKEDLRPHWQRYTSKALLLVFVVDSSNSQLFPVAKKHLHELLAPCPSLPVMVLANKQDLPGSCSITDLHEALSLSEVGDRQMFLIGTYVRRGEADLSSGVQDARDLIISMVCDGK